MAYSHEASAQANHGNQFMKALTQQASYRSKDVN